MENRIEYWLNDLRCWNTETILRYKEKKELYDILVKLYEDNKMIYGAESEYVRND